MRRLSALLAALAFSALSAACSSIEIEKVLVITDVHTGWYDAGIQPGGKNKLVPSISFHLKNQGGEPLTSVQMNAIFRRVNEAEAWGEHFVKAIGPEPPLAAGATSGLVVLRSNLGYTGDQPRNVMLKHHDFVDAKVEIFAKHGRRTWVKLGEYPIARDLLTQ